MLKTKHRVDQGGGGSRVREQRDTQSYIIRLRKSQSKKKVNNNIVDFFDLITCCHGYHVGGGEGVQKGFGRL